MKTMTIKSCLILIAALCLSTTAFAQANFTVTTNYTVNQAIPDNDINGVSFTRNLSSPVFNFNPSNILDLNVTLNITGDFNGDLYAYITHGSGFAVLLNRVGRTASNPDGYGDDGFNIRLDDQAGSTRDVHTYRLTLGGALPNGTQLTGSWLPDGRNVSPLNTLDTDARTALLNSFNGLDPNGSYTLFIADLSPGGNSTIVSWGLEVTIPEPGTIGLMALGGLLMFYFARRRLKTA